MIDPRGCARKALEILERVGTDPLPKAYAVAFEMVARPGSAVAVEFMELIGRSNGSPALVAVESVYAKHFEMPLVRPLEETAASLQEQLGNAMRTVSEASEASESYGRSLTETHDRLTEARETGGDPLGPISEAILRTVEHQSAQETLTKALEDTRTEMDAIRRNYEAAIRDARAEVDEAREEARTDPLTQLRNRRSFEEALRVDADRARRNGEALSVLMLDIDHFKRVNDTFGHPVGDSVIKHVAERLSKSLRKGDIPARVGGEEFAVILHKADAAGAADVAERIRASVDQQLSLRESGQGIGRITVSVGVAQYVHGETEDALVERADAALYDSKRSGRNKVTVAADPRVALEFEAAEDTPALVAGMG